MLKLKDINGNRINVKKKELTIRVSVYGVLRSGNAFLVQWNPAVKRPTLPGGGVELGETTHETLIREFKEETGLTIRVGKLITVKDTFYLLEKKYIQAIFIVFEVEQLGGELLIHGNGKDSEKAAYVSLGELEKEGMQEILKEVLREYYQL